MAKAKKERSQKWYFLYALIVTLVIFNLGIYMGYKLENSRIDKINDWYLQSDILLLDQRIQSDAFDMFDLDCKLMVDENIKFADNIFEEAQKMARFEKASRLNNEIIVQHRRFDLLRTLFWVNSIKIREKCNSDYHNIVYLYEYDDVSLATKSEQSVFSNFLGELKNKKGNEIMLIPIAGDNDVVSLKLLMEEFGIAEEDLPVVLIDEKIKINTIDELGKIEQYLN